MIRAFTLLELLVVITIIVVLLALLAPALDKAVYQSELVACGAKLHSVLSGAQVYAVDHQRRYPHRQAVVNRADTSAWELSPSGSGNPQDLRPAIKSYVSLNKALNCPLNGAGLEIESAGHADVAGPHKIYSSYALWFGWKWQDAGSATKGMFRIGDRFDWIGKDFNLLASDMSVADDSGYGYGNHPDDREVWVHKAWRGETGPSPLPIKYTLAWWTGGANRGTLDLNFGYQDGSVLRISGVKFDRGHPNNAGEPTRDERMAKAPYWGNHASMNEPTRLVQLPEN